MIFRTLVKIQAQSKRAQNFEISHGLSIQLTPKTHVKHQPGSSVFTMSLSVRVSTPGRGRAKSTGLPGASGGVSGTVNKRRTTQATQQNPTTSNYGALASVSTQRQSGKQRMWTRVGDKIVIVGNTENGDKATSNKSRRSKSTGVVPPAAGDTVDEENVERPRNDDGFPHFYSQRDYMTLTTTPSLGRMVSRIDSPGTLQPSVGRKPSARTMIAAATIHSTLWKQKGSQWIKRDFCVDNGNLCQTGTDKSGRRRLMIALSGDVVVRRKGERVFKIERTSVDFCRSFRAKTVQEVSNWLTVLRQHGCTVH